MSPASADSAERPGKDLGLRHELRAVHALVYRDLLRLAGQPTHTALMLVHPVLYLLVLGGGLAALIPTSSLGVGYQAYLFPGILMMTVQMPAITVGIRLIADRQSGYLRELLMAPVRRPLCSWEPAPEAPSSPRPRVRPARTGRRHRPALRPSTVAAAHRRHDPGSFTLTALALTLAVSISRAGDLPHAAGPGDDAAGPLPGGFFPWNLPGWAHTVAAANPLAYGVDLLRRCIALRVPGQASGAGVTWSSFQPPLLVEGALLLTLGTVALLWAAHVFSRPE